MNNSHKQTDLVSGIVITTNKLIYNGKESRNTKKYLLI